MGNKGILFKITLEGLYSATGVGFNTSYVIASDPTNAYRKVRKYLDGEDIGFRTERECIIIETIASSDFTNGARAPLFI